MREINICMITDNNYVVPTTVAMTSAICHKDPQTVYHFYLLVAGVSRFNRERLAMLAADRVKIDFIEADAAKYSQIQVKSHVPQSAALKFDLASVLDMDKVLYMDGDILVRRDLSGFYNTDLNGFLVAAVRDMGGELKQRFHEKTGVEKYFNSGVMLLNLKEMRQENCGEKLFRAKTEHPKWQCMDQDAFNFVFNNRVKWVSLKYNAMIPLYRAYGYSQQEINSFYGTDYADDCEMQSDAVLIHCAGESRYRPWKVLNGTFGDLWDEYYRRSPFAGISLNRRLEIPVSAPRPVEVKTKPQPEERFRCQKYYLFSFIPLWKQKVSLGGHRTKYYLFGFIPLLKIKRK